MAKSPLKAGDGVGFIRAYTDELRETEHEYGVYIFSQMGVSGQRGVLEFRFTAWKQEDRRGERPEASYVATYPTAHVQSLEAFLYQCLVRLSMQLRDKKRWPLGRP